MSARTKVILTSSASPSLLPGLHLGTLSRNRPASPPRAQAELPVVGESLEESSLSLLQWNPPHPACEDRVLSGSTAGHHAYAGSRSELKGGDPHLELDSSALLGRGASEKVPNLERRPRRGERGVGRPGIVAEGRPSGARRAWAAVCTSLYAPCTERVG